MEDFELFMVVYIVFKLYNLFFIVVILGNFLKILFLKLFFILFFYVFIGCFIIFFKEIVGCIGFILVNVFWVDIKILGLIKIMWYFFNDNFIGLNRFFILVVKIGLF